MANRLPPVGDEKLSCASSKLIVRRAGPCTRPDEGKGSLTSFVRMGEAINCRRLVTMLVVIGLACVAQNGSGEEVEQKRGMTVKDLIEVSYIVDPAPSTKIELRAEQPRGMPIYSPDGRHFLLVTQRGVLATNALEGTIWLFSVQRAEDYALHRSLIRPIPTKLATVSSTSNTPVIKDVRWIDGGRRVAFLGKNRKPYQRLFVIDVRTRGITAVTKPRVYVTAYDVQGDVVAYTTLSRQQISPGFVQDMVYVGGRSPDELLNRTSAPAIEDIDERFLLKCASSLHILKGGRDTRVAFRLAGAALRLFVPTLSLSPDAKVLITVASVSEVPLKWEQYQSQPGDLGTQWAMLKNVHSVESLWRPEQYVIVNLDTGIVQPLVDAPAGRDLGHGAIPTRAFWFADNRRAVLTNTYLPFIADNNEGANDRRREIPSIAMVDVSTRAVQEITSIALPGHQESEINDITWDASRRELVLRYASVDTAGICVPHPQIYVSRAGAWTTLPTDGAVSGGGGRGNFSVREDLNHPPALWAQTDRVIWDPNPQLGGMQLGKAEIYHWRDARERAWSGVLLLPVGYETKRRYPLVIQTHGYQSDRFFADGEYTTGSGGRAFSARNIIVLQLDMALSHLTSPDEAPDNVAGFLSAVGQLVADGAVDERRVGIIGFSRTCLWVRYALTHYPRLFKAASLTDGFNPSYVAYVLSGEVSEFRRETEAMNGGAPFGDNLTKWLQNSVGFNLDKIQSPLLISIFEKSELLPEWETYSGLRQLRRPVEMQWWWKGNAPHVLVQPVQRYASQQSTVDWFDFWLNEREDDDPAKKQEYTHWRELRRIYEGNQKNSTLR